MLEYAEIMPVSEYAKIMTNTLVEKFNERYKGDSENVVSWNYNEVDNDITIIVLNIEVKIPTNIFQYFSIDDIFAILNWKINRKRIERGDFIWQY